MTDQTSLIPAERIEGAILTIRDQKVILDSTLAELFGVTTKRFNEQVRRNQDRFPPDFMFQLTQEEFQILRSQIATSSWGGRRTPPYAFTEHGVVMAANVLKSSIAIRASIEVVRAFNRLRMVLAAHQDLARKIEELERKFEGKMQQHEALFVELFKSIRQLMIPPSPSRRQIGFKDPEKP